MCVECQRLKVSEGMFVGRAIVSQEKYWGQILRAVLPPLDVQEEKGVASGSGRMSVQAPVTSSACACSLCKV